VQDERRQREDGDFIRPVEQPIETGKRAVEREGERSEQRDAQPEEMERRLIARASEPD
jgi:hypothetical protein